MAIRLPLSARSRFRIRHLVSSIINAKIDSVNCICVRTTSGGPGNKINSFPLEQPEGVFYNRVDPVGT